MAYVDQNCARYKSFVAVAVYYRLNLPHARIWPFLRVYDAVDGLAWIVWCAGNRM